MGGAATGHDGAKRIEVEGRGGAGEAGAAQA